jgi:hypothetical protein
LHPLDKDSMKRAMSCALLHDARIVSDFSRPARRNDLDGESACDR